MAEDKRPDFGQLIDLLFKLTWNRVFLALAAVLVYTFYENRERVVPIALGSPMLLWIAVFIVAATGVGWTIKSLVEREFVNYETRIAEQAKLYEHRLAAQDERMHEMAAANAQLTQDVIDCRVDCEATIKAALIRIEAQLPGNYTL